MLQTSQAPYRVLPLNGGKTALIERHVVSRFSQIVLSYFHIMGNDLHDVHCTLVTNHQYFGGRTSGHLSLEPNHPTNKSRESKSGHWVKETDEHG